MSARIVMHVDMDAFYASVELRRRPELRGTAVIVGGSPRGVVLSATLRGQGPRRTVRHVLDRGAAAGAQGHLPQRPTSTAIRRSPRRSSRSSGRSRSVVESASIDEAFLDLTGAMRMFGGPAQIGEYVRAVVADEQQITCSVGIGPTKFVAKVASRAAKPDGLVEVPPDRVVDFLHPMPVEAMWGVGNATAREAAPAWHLHRRRPRPHPAGGLASGLRPARERHAAASSPGGGTGAGSCRWSRSTASVPRRPSATTPTSPRPYGASCSGWRTGPPPDAQAADAGPHDHDLGAVRRFHRADPVQPPCRHRPMSPRRSTPRRCSCTSGSGSGGRGSAGSGSGWNSSSRRPGLSPATADRP